MAILSDKTIKEYMDGGKLVIDPILDEKQIQPSSIDMRLGKEFKVFKVIRKAYIDPKDEEDLSLYMESTTVKDGEAFIIHPNEFALATTLEYVKVPDDLVARVEGRSSMGRLGVTMHVHRQHTVPLPTIATTYQRQHRRCCAVRKVQFPIFPCLYQRPLSGKVQPQERSFL